MTGYAGHVVGRTSEELLLGALETKGPGTMRQLARRTGLRRACTYEALLRLVGKGMVSRRRQRMEERPEFARGGVPFVYRAVESPPLEMAPGAVDGIRLEEGDRVLVREAHFVHGRLTRFVLRGIGRGLRIVGRGRRFRRESVREHQAQANGIYVVQRPGLQGMTWLARREDDL